jgi:hypothetical protein
MGYGTNRAAAIQIGRQNVMSVLADDRAARCDWNGMVVVVLGHGRHGSESGDEQAESQYLQKTGIATAEFHMFLLFHVKGGHS